MSSGLPQSLPGLCLRVSLCLMPWSFAGSLSLCTGSPALEWSSTGGCCRISTLARTALLVTLLATGMLSYVGAVLWDGLDGLWCLQLMASLATDQLNFARDALSGGLCIGLCTLAVRATAWLLISHYL